MNSAPAPSSTNDASPDTSGERRQLERRIEDRHKLERVSVRVLLLGLLAGLGLAIAAAALWMQIRGDRQLDTIRASARALANADSDLRDQLTALSKRLADSEARLEEVRSMNARIAELESSVTTLRERAESGERAWVLAEAHYLLEVANRRLALEHDVTTAIAALEAADERLASLRDPALNGARRMLASEIQALHVIPQPDIAGIAARLASAEDLAAGLPVLGAIQPRYEPDRDVTATAPGLARAWQVFKATFAGMVSVHRIGEDAVELVSLEEQNVRRHHLQLLLFSARLAAVRGDEKGYQTSVRNSRAWLQEFFDPRDPGVAGLSRELDQLELLKISTAMPDISRSLKELDRIRAAGKTP